MGLPTSRLGRGGVAGLAARVPRPLRRLLATLAVTGALVGAFIGIVLPLFKLGEGGPPSAEISGLPPESIPLGRPIAMELAIDNTGNASIHPVCIEASFEPPIAVDSVVFQGLDRVPFRDGRACGGRLNSQETINVRLWLRATSAGVVRVVVTPAQGPRHIGPPIRAAVRVNPER